jgi:D-serine deaminase-like pyridoxal phosphate-dependent protein
LLIDLNLMEENIHRMSQYFSTIKSKLRPHTKTHKSPILAHEQIKAGAMGICCQKLGEAEVMVNSGINDILITNEIVDLEKIERLVTLTRYSDVKVVVDNLQIAKTTSKIALKHGVQLGILVEVDIRNKRCGLPPGKPSIEFVKKVIKLKGLNFCGLMGYEGPFFELQNFKERKVAAHKLLNLLKETVEMIENDGIDVKIVSAGSTGTYNITGKYPKVTEIQAGSYIFMDSTYRKLKGIDFNCALTVLATVISRPIPTRVIINVGLKAITSEFGMPLVKNMDEAKVIHLSEEHGIIQVNPSNKIKVRDKIELIPSHCCTTVNLHEWYYGVRDDAVEVVWPITARGKFQ